MGLSKRLRRARYVYGWRLRHWWLDTPSGRMAQIMALCLAVLACIMELIRMGIAAMAPADPNKPAQAIYWWVAQLVILAVSAVISAAMRPKQQKPAVADAPAPSTNDGQYVKHHFGTCWVDDSFVLAWKVVGTSKIKTKGGKK